jgi:hypothetical protein
MNDDVGLWLNVAPVSVPHEAAVDVVVVPYQDEEHLSSLREKQRGQHLLLRRGDECHAVALVPGCLSPLI